MSRHEEICCLTEWGENLIAYRSAVRPTGYAHLVHPLACPTDNQENTAGRFLRSSLVVNEVEKTQALFYSSGPSGQSVCPAVAAVVGALFFKLFSRCRFTVPSLSKWVDWCLIEPELKPMSTQ